MPGLTSRSKARGRAQREVVLRGTLRAGPWPSTSAAPQTAGAVYHQNDVINGDYNINLITCIYIHIYILINQNN